MSLVGEGSVCPLWVRGVCVFCGLVGGKCKKEIVFMCRKIQYLNHLYHTVKLLLALWESGSL